MKQMLRYEVPVDGAGHEVRLTFDPVAVAARVIRSPVAHLTMEYVVEFWAEGYPGEPQAGAARRFQVFGTGQAVPEGARWRGTCPRLSEADGGYVWHLYETTLCETTLCEVTRP